MKIQLQNRPSLHRDSSMLTSPGAQLLATTLKIYGSEEAFADDVIKAYGEFVQEFNAADAEIFSSMIVYGAVW